MKVTLSTNEAVHRLLRDEYANWSPQGARALVEHLIEVENMLDREMEFECCAIRCQFAEFSSALEAASEHYNFDPSTDEDDDDEKERKALEWLEEQTTVVQFKGGVIIEQF